MVRLTDIAEQIKATLKGSGNPEIFGVTENSGQAGSGYLFAAVKGRKTDGHQYVAEALKKGAVAVLSDSPAFSCEAPVLLVDDIRTAMAEAAALVYGYPTKKILTVGLTGTNGKTTTAYLLEAVFRRAGLEPGVMGTVDFRWADKAIPADNTTPEGPLLQQTLGQMAEDGVKAAILEVSSHALSLGRTKGCFFRIVVFTNLSQDHLDYHLTMADYFAAKKLLFTEHLAPETKAVINIDDEYGRRLARELGDRALTYGFNDEADIKGSDFSQEAGGLSFTVADKSGWSRLQKSPLLGKINAYNVLAALSAAVASGVDINDASAFLTEAEGAPGRLDKILVGGRLVLVDYAHTPDALEKALATCREIAAGRRLLVVFGCGGDRDKTKRPLMGRAALAGADLAVVTSDNPRTEEPLAILADIEAGLDSGLKIIPGPDGEIDFSKKGYILEPDRRKAIKLAVKAMKPGEVLLIAGKGHETYQLTKSGRLDFDDRLVAAEFLREVGS